ncbi:Rpr2 domain-containing protein [Ceratobasidium theobromae]|uniref:Rpr2 domain-containing protein n=1 Tax=Ceratobasidium theobromae TaxID=1582974 RepID=A0A5N5QA78_9AGAM|nr:Rpr2 domain-containing protein [Ceratobasidium theobromae]
MESNRHKSFKFKDWDEHLLRFLETAGLDQAARGFKLDMMVLNHTSEKRLLAALEQFCTTAMASKTSDLEDETPSHSLDEMKQRYLPVDVATPGQASSTTSIPQSHSKFNQNTKAVSRFLADVRLRVDQSNRDEFVHRKPRRESGPNGSARTDAVKLNRDIQMKYDIVKNQDGPLGKTMKNAGGSVNVNVSGTRISSPENPNTAFNERFQAIETHLAVRYVPAPPADFMLRVKHIEEHIIRLEKEYPPWAALHFNQPHRGWPPAPRESIIVIPPHLTRSTRLEEADESGEHHESGGRGKGKARGGKESSLLRAALDKLQPQAKSDGPPPTVPNRDLMQRMNFLLQTSVHLQRDQGQEAQRLARRHVKTVKRISNGAVVKLDPSVKRVLCKGCNAVLVPGLSASVRVKCTVQGAWQDDKLHMFWVPGGAKNSSGTSLAGACSTDGGGMCGSCSGKKTRSGKESEI